MTQTPQGKAYADQVFKRAVRLGHYEDTEEGRKTFDRINSKSMYWWWAGPYDKTRGWETVDPWRQR